MTENIGAREEARVMQWPYPTVLLVALSAAALVACSPSQHTVGGMTRAQLAEAEREARELCVKQRGANDQPPMPFTTDGCSAWPDCRWKLCCVKHDMSYWCGGTSKQREAADEELRRCVAKDQGRPTMATLMRIGVRGGGVPWLPVPWRWGYGWPWPRGYDR